MEKSFDKHYVKRDPANMERILIKDEKPILGEIAKPDCRLEQRHANILNKNWQQTGIFYKESPTKNKKEEKTEERIDLEAEATKLGLKFMANIGDEKLKSRIEEELLKSKGE